MSFEWAAEYALFKEESKDEIDPPAASAPEESLSGEPSNKLTRREREVASLVTHGLTNREVSTALGISERTAGNHVARILKKLGLRSRAQIAGWAGEHQSLTLDPD